MPATLPIRLPAQNGLYQSVLIRALESLGEGALRMRFPDGTDIIYGEGGAGSAGPSGVINALGWVNKLLQRFRGNDLRGIRSNIHAHYDLGNDFFRLFLRSAARRVEEWGSI